MGTVLWEWEKQMAESNGTNIIARYGPVAILDARKAGEALPAKYFPVAVLHGSEEVNVIESVPMPSCLLPDLVEYFAYLLRSWRLALDAPITTIQPDWYEQHRQQMETGCTVLEFAIRGISQAYPGLNEALALIGEQDVLAMQVPSRRPQFPIPPDFQIIWQEILIQAAREGFLDEPPKKRPVRLQDICALGRQVAQLGQFHLYAVTFLPESAFSNPAPYYAIILEQQAREPLEVGLIGMIESDEQGIWQRIHLCERTLYYAIGMHHFRQARHEMNREYATRHGYPPSEQVLQWERIEREITQAWEQRHQAISEAFTALTPPG
jgi:hypothetical protein